MSSIIQITNRNLNDFVLLSLAVGQVVFLSIDIGFYGDDGSIFTGLWVGMFLISPLIVGIDIHLSKHKEWEPPLYGALWIIGSLIPLFSPSILITYILRRYEMISKDGLWVGWPLVVGGSILAIGLSLLLVDLSGPIGVSGVFVLLALTSLPGLAMYYDLRFLKHSDEYDFPIYNWLWILGILVWFVQFGVFIIWAVWRTKVSSISNQRAMIDIIYTYFNTDSIPSFNSIRTPTSGAEKADENDRSETAGKKNNASTAAKHQSKAEDAIETAETAKANSNFGAAADSYKTAITLYQTALNELDPEATERHEAITEVIATTRSDLSTIKKPQEQRKEAIRLLTPPERSFQEAIVAFSEDDFTLAKIRFRQARDAFEEALETTTESEDERFNPPVVVSVELDRKLSSTVLTEIEAIPDSAAETLAEHDVDTIDELECTNESPWTPLIVEEVVEENLISEEAATTLRLLSWWHNDSSEFDSGHAISKRQQQAAYGFNQAK